MESRIKDNVGRAWWRFGVLFVLLISGMALLFFDIPPVVLSWETASEVGTAGFNVYRAEDLEGDFVQINTALIPAEGDELIGASYRFEDDDVLPTRQYHYRIEEVEWDGGVNVYPETVNVRAGLPRLWVKIEGGALLALALLVLWRTWKR